MGPPRKWGPGQIAPVAPPSRRPCIYLYMERKAFVVVPFTVNASHEPIAVSIGNNSIQQCYLKFIPMYNYFPL